MDQALRFSLAIPVRSEFKNTRDLLFKQVTFQSDLFRGVERFVPSYAAKHLPTEQKTWTIDDYDTWEFVLGALKEQVELNVQELLGRCKELKQLMKQLRLKSCGDYLQSRHDKFWTLYCNRMSRMDDIQIELASTRLVLAKHKGL